MRHLNCPVCNSTFYFRNEAEMEDPIVITERYRRKDKRQEAMTNIIYLLIGALLALAGVQLPACSEYSTTELENESYDQTDTDQIFDTEKGIATDNNGLKPDTGSDEQAGDTAINEQLDSATDEQMDSATDEQMAGDTETDIGFVSSIVADCEAMKQFFSDCYWSEQNFTGPTYTQITAECSLGNTITESLAQWHACWKLNDESCTCPLGARANDFECSPNKCQQWITCMTTCRL